MNSILDRIYNGIVKENPVLILILGMCPAVLAATSGGSGLAIGISTLVVLVLANLLSSLLRNIIPDEVRLPSYMVLTAFLATAVQLLIQAYIPAAKDALGMNILLLTACGLLLGSTEACAGKKEPMAAVLSAVRFGVIFAISLVVLGCLRELFGDGTVFGAQIMPGFYEPALIFTKLPGAFMVLCLLVAIVSASGIQANADDADSSDRSCMGAAQGIKTAAIVGIAVMLVLTITAVIANLLYTGILLPLGIEFLHTIVFVFILAVLVMIAEKNLTCEGCSVKAALGKYLPLITIAVAVLGMILNSMTEEFSLGQSLKSGIGAGACFTVVICLLTGIRAKADEEAIPAPFRGAPFMLLCATLMAIVFAGFGSLSF